MVADQNKPYIVKPEISALASAIQDLLTDPVSRRHIGLRNRARAVAEFDESAMFARYRELFSCQA
jgi:glycosyltransferase involved in cell wall biosynthesis